MQGETTNGCAPDPSAHGAADLLDASGAGVATKSQSSDVGKPIPLAMQRPMQADVPGAIAMTLDASHSPFFSQPQLLADRIAQASQD